MAKMRLTSDVFQTPASDGHVNIEIDTQSIPVDMTREQLAQELVDYATERKVEPKSVVLIGGGKRAWSLAGLLKSLGFPCYAKPNLLWDKEARPSPWGRKFVETK
jgi:hypothetical protein